MSDRHVKPADDGWSVEKPDAQRPSAKTPTQAEAIKRAVEIVANDGGGDVIVHGTNGDVRETRTVEADAEDTDRTAAALVASATGTGARVTAESAAAEVSDAAEDIADDAAQTAQQIAGEAQAAGRRAADRVDATAREAGEQIVAGADRAATVGAGVGQEAESAADRVGRQIHAATESAAAPLDRLAAALNPVRITGRAVGVLAAGGLHLAGLGAARGTAAAQRGARELTGR